MAQRNMALGRESITTASTSMTSSLTFLTRSVLFLRSFPLARASFLPNRVVEVTWGSKAVVVKGVDIREEVVVAEFDEAGETVNAVVTLKRSIKVAKMERTDFMMMDGTVSI